MKSGVKLLDEYFNCRNISIPVYQRKYEWKKENCAQLFKDLKMISKRKDRKEHFFGTIITLTIQSTDIKSIIDGQQRIMTIAILMAAIRDHILEQKGEETKLSSRIDNKLRYIPNQNLLDDDESEFDDSEDDDSEELVDGDITEEEYDDEESLDLEMDICKDVYIEPVKGDRQAYYALINRDSDKYVVSSNIMINYEFFRQELRNLPPDISYTDIYNALDELKIVPILLDDNDNAQEVFESINSTGLKLTEADKIRNFVLMRVKTEQQPGFYKSYWEPIESNVYDLSSFFRHYLMVKTGRKVAFTDVYTVFKQTILDLEKEKSTIVIKNGKKTRDRSTAYKNILSEIVDYSKIYKMLQSANFDSISTRSSLYMRYINYLEITVTYPFLMNVIDDYNKSKNDIDSIEIDNILRSILNMLIRRSVCNRYSTGLDNYFISLYRTVSELDSEGKFSDKLNYVILNKTGAQDYDDDDKVRFAFENEDQYRSGNSRSISAILALIDGGKDKSNTIDDVISGNLSVEHVMPQKLDSSWKKVLGDNYQTIHKDNVHKIGNLTLIAYNSEYSNKSFDDKKTLIDEEDNVGKGFNYSGLEINDYIKQQSKWTLEQINARKELMITAFFEKVPQLTTSCVVTPKRNVFYFDQDPMDLVNMKVKGFILDGEEFECSNAYEANFELLRRLYEKDPTVLYELVQNDTDLGKDYSDVEDENNKEIATGVFVHIHNGNYGKAQAISQLLSLYGINPAEVCFYENIT